MRLIHFLFFVAFLWTSPLWANDTLEQLKKRLSQEPHNVVLVSEYILALQDAQEHQEAEQIAQDFLKKIPKKEIAQAQNWVVLSVAIKNIHQKEFEIIVQNAKTLENNLGQIFMDYIVEIIEKELLDSSKPEQLSLLKTYYYQILKNVQAVEFEKKYYDLFLEMYFYKLHQDWANYFPLMISWTESYHAQNWYELLKKASELSEFGQEYLNKAEVWAKKSTEIRPCSLSFYLYAKILAQQKRQEAVFYLQKAQDQKPDSELSWLISELSEQIREKGL